MSEMRLIPDTDGRYSGCETGRIYSHVTNRYLVGVRRRDGYIYVKLRVRGEGLQGPVHRFVASAFHGRPGRGQQVNHKDLCKTNNTPSNLEWCSPKENSRHAWATLPPETIRWMRERRSFGAIKMNRQKRTLTRRQVAMVRRLLGEGVAQGKIAARVGLSRRAIWQIKVRLCYADW